MKIDRAVIVGAGLIGASLAAAGRHAGLFGCVVGVGRRRANLEDALSRGLVDEIEQDLAAALVGADLVVVAAPVGGSVALLEQVAASAPPACVISDVGSVKTPICRRACELGLEARFVGAHPMAGGTATGAAAADPKLFHGRVTVLTPTPGADAAAVAGLRELWEAVGARVIEMDPQRHDDTVALSSHLPQMVAFALAATAAGAADQEALRSLVAGGFRDTTRLATSDEDMWAEIAALNRESLGAALRAFSGIWDELAQAIEQGDDARLRALMRKAKRFKTELEK